MSAERDKAIAAQREAADVLARLIDGVADEVLCRAPASGKWSVRAIIAHMAEDELASSWRYRQMIEHADVALPGFDQDEWARLGDYEAWSVRDALEMFRLLRDANLRMLGRLSATEWERRGLPRSAGA